ncbi:hypothetical protein Acr_00g0012590 [Actinidia rufa]|uniref:Retrotransposon Copia-like N-terminal domain-containing protein n=1 Tax=Actinidia rufa TaxID=165716 RepID=A0A7J0D9S1_9ERIC|nr:hypothetical protein Acr_00g0012590 [Actinidia rufa]
MSKGLKPLLLRRWPYTSHPPLQLLRVVSNQSHSANSHGQQQPSPSTANSPCVAASVQSSLPSSTATAAPATSQLLPLQLLSAPRSSSPCTGNNRDFKAAPTTTKKSEPQQPPCVLYAASVQQAQLCPPVSDLSWVAPTYTVLVPSPIPVSLSHSQPTQRVMSVLLNGKNFHAWSRSFQLYLGRKHKTRWILGKEPKPTESDPKFDEWIFDNCIILGWMFNLMEDRVYHMFMYHDTVHSLWTALTQIYAHSRNESRIFELYRETRWEELAQYEPLSDFSSDGAVESKRFDRRHTYQFLIDLKSDFETLRTQILNTSPLPSLYEAFAIVDGDERRRRLLPFLSDGGRGRGTPRTGVIAEVEPIPTDLPDFKQLQLQIAQLQSHLGLAPAFTSSGPKAAIVAENPTALHDLDSEVFAVDDDPIPPRPLPILEPHPPPLNASLPPIHAPLPASSLESGVVPDTPTGPNHPAPQIGLSVKSGTQWLHGREEQCMVPTRNPLILRKFFSMWHWCFIVC